MGGVSPIGKYSNTIGSTKANLVLQTLGKIYIQYGKSTKLLDDVIKELSSAPSSSEKLKDSTIIASDLDSVNDVEDGMFIYTTSNDNLYLQVNGKPILILEHTQQQDSGDYVLRTGDILTGALQFDYSGVPFILKNKILIPNLNSQYLGGYTDSEFAKKAVKETITGLWTHSNEVKFIKSIGTPQFASGYFGYGWRLDSTTNTLTIDNLVVRKTMQVYELVVNELNATNGSLFVSNTGKIKTVTEITVGNAVGQVDTLTYKGQYRYSESEISNNYINICDEDFNVEFSYIKDIQAFETNGTFTTINIYDEYYANQPIFEIEFEKETYPIFRVGDLIRCQKLDKDSNTIKYYDGIVLKHYSTYSYFIQLCKVNQDMQGPSTDQINVILSTKLNMESNEYVNTSTTPYADVDLYTPVAGDTIVQIGNLINQDRQGLIYLTSSDQGAPFMDVYSGINRPDFTVVYEIPKFDENANLIQINGVYQWEYNRTLKARLGRLDGVKDSIFNNQQPNGFGLYSDNVFLTGEFYLRNGQTVVDFTKEGIFMAYKKAGISITDNRIKYGKEEYNSALLFKKDNGLENYAFYLPPSVKDVIIDENSATIITNTSQLKYSLIDLLPNLIYNFYNSSESLITEEKDYMYRYGELNTTEIDNIFGLQFDDDYVDSIREIEEYDSNISMYEQDYDNELAEWQQATALYNQYLTDLEQYEKDYADWEINHQQWEQDKQQTEEAGEEFTDPEPTPPIAPQEVPEPGDAPTMKERPQVVNSIYTVEYYRMMKYKNQENYTPSCYYDTIIFAVNDNWYLYTFKNATYSYTGQYYQVNDVKYNQIQKTLDTIIGKNVFHVINSLDNLNYTETREIDFGLTNYTNTFLGTLTIAGQEREVYLIRNLTKKDTDPNTVISLNADQIVLSNTDGTVESLFTTETSINSDGTISDKALFKTDLIQATSVKVSSTDKNYYTELNSKSIYYNKDNSEGEQPGLFIYPKGVWPGKETSDIPPYYIKAIYTESLQNNIDSAFAGYFSKEIGGGAILVSSTRQFNDKDFNGTGYWQGNKNYPTTIISGTNIVSPIIASQYVSALGGLSTSVTVFSNGQFNRYVHGKRTSGMNCSSSYTIVNNIDDILVFIDTNVNTIFLDLKDDFSAVSHLATPGKIYRLINLSTGTKQLSITGYSNSKMWSINPNQILTCILASVVTDYEDTNQYGDIEDKYLLAGVKHTKPYAIKPIVYINTFDTL